MNKDAKNIKITVITDDGNEINSIYASDETESSVGFIGYPFDVNGEFWLVQDVT